MSSKLPSLNNPQGKHRSRVKNTKQRARARQLPSKQAPQSLQVMATQSGKPIYEQVDKLEFFVPSESIEHSDVPTKSTMVAIPVTDGTTLRMVKIKRCRVYVWNRGPQDLYLEVLQPFGAHNNAQTIVAWGPVAGKKNRPQMRWTIKANKPGGMFTIDLTDNNFTLPATVSVKDGTVDKLCLCLFAFAVTRNSTTFTGTSDAKSSRSLQMKIVFDYWGNDLPQQKAVMLKGSYADMGATSKYPLQDADTVFRELGLVTLGKLLNISVFDELRLTNEPVGSLIPFQSRKVYCDSTNGPYYPDTDVIDSLSAVRIVGFDRQLNTLAAVSQMYYFPVSPTKGLIWKVSARMTGSRDHLLVSGFGNAIVHSSRFDEDNRPAKMGWYLAATANGINNPDVFPVIHANFRSSRDVLNEFANAQGMHLGMPIRLDVLMPYHPGWQAFCPRLDGLFSTSTAERLLVSHRNQLQGSVEAFSLASWITMITVIVKVIEAAYATYAKYAPQNVEDVLGLPDHKLFVETDCAASFEIV